MNTVSTCYTVDGIVDNVHVGRHRKQIRKKIPGIAVKTVPSITLLVTGSCGRLEESLKHPVAIYQLFQEELVF